jgi:peptidase M48-like protein
VTYVAHGLTLALAWFLVINAALCLLVAIGVRILLSGRSPRSTTFWYALRLMPAFVSFAFVAGLFVPSYWRFEPREAIEGFDVTLTACAAAAALMLAVGFARGLRACRDAARRTREWIRAGRAVRLDGVTIPAFIVDAGAPLMVLTGIFRSRIFVSRQLLDALTPAELKATIDHEMSHSQARDNLKRLAMRLAPDFLSSTAIAAGLERRWASAAEHAADRAAAGDDPAARCELAAALVKVAKLMPQPAMPLEPISTLVGGGDLASRVERLLDAPVAARSRHARFAGWTAIVFAAAIVLVTYAPLVRIVHDATEILVNSLP